MNVSYFLFVLKISINVLCILRITQINIILVNDLIMNKIFLIIK